ncbi:Microtubule-binding protein TANGLED [Hibiscus syriacus]|uniref:Microtubule-binding protein TANGLED n=1 Tax=Hibiscus syriacus TaxID=106335 RepID=A0A6A2YX54_HIBSY|nr:microtubule-binding protein TANGLED-like [Hibiscus syriacus]KAE8684111.1 Microtubule-binding protein TANGLED [Hibiscus syriacus]
MVARTPPKQRKILVAPLDPVLLRETVKKVEKCMARLQELQYTVAGGTKVISGVKLSPGSTRAYFKTSLRCKQESLRMKNGTSPRKSPVGKFPAAARGEWKRMSLPAMLVGETVGEILQASQFAKEILAAVDNKVKKTTVEDPKTPLTERKKQKQQPENTELKARRKREKQNKLQLIRTESESPSLRRACSRINFKVSPPKFKEHEKENNRLMANRVSPRIRPWAKKTVLFPNPLFSSTSASQQQKFCKTRSPVIARNRQTPHKFLIKSPPSASKFQVKIKSPPVVSLSPTRSTNTSKRSPKASAASKLRRSFSPSRLANRLVSPLKSRKSSEKGIVRSFSPSRLANRLVSPLRSRKGLQKTDGPMSGMKQRPVLMPMRFSTGKI